ncbi:MAG TPA: serine/threonine-protein kinase, partial [Polyangiales bacterium]|nr:serine/threonine-protein kinase [Polyangiales bacterium]
DGVSDDGTAYLVMELLDGETVGTLQRNKGGKLELALVLDIVDQLLDVLATAHARGVVHREIKPENLFVTRNGTVKVLDFGIARMFEHVPGATIETQAGVMLGTPAFMAQEQARGRWDEVDQRSDLWAVGATMFTLLTSEFVHAADTPNEQLGRAMTVPARSLRAVQPSLPEDLMLIVDRALRYERDERWPDALSMQQALRVFRGERTTLPEAPMTALRGALGPRSVATRSSEDFVDAVPRTGLWRRARYALLAVAAALLAVSAVKYWHVPRMSAQTVRAQGAAAPARASVLVSAPARQDVSPAAETIERAANASTAVATAPTALTASVGSAPAHVDSVNRKVPIKAPYARNLEAHHTRDRSAVAAPDPMDRRH